MKHRRSPSLSRLLWIPVALLGAMFVVQSMPDLVRYMKVESM